MTKNLKTRRKTTSKGRLSDPTTLYALDVTEKRIIAGPHVRAACERHLHDIKTADQRGLIWDINAAARAIGFFRDVLCLNGGEHEGKPFILLAWEAFIVGCLFGWKRADGYRRFRMAFVEVGKGNGKSPIAAGIGLYMLTADDETRAENYAAAAKKDQAMVLFRDAVAMVDQSPALRKRIKKSGVGSMVWNLAYLEKGSFFRPISTDDQGQGQSGPRPHYAAVDEVHEHKTNATVEWMRAGTKGRRQALIFLITNSGVNRQSVCFEYHEYACKVAARQLEDDSFFGYVCALDEEDDPFEDPTCWTKANPSLGTTIQPIYLEEQVRAAKNMPSKESIVRRLNFCQWVDAYSPWIPGDLWRAAEVAAEDFSVQDRGKRSCYLGVDLSESKDLTALAKLWPDPDDEDAFDAELQFWTPKDTLSQREMLDRVPYAAWCEHEHLEAVPGMTIDYAFVAEYIAQLLGELNVQALTFDQWHMAQLRGELTRIGVPNFLHGSDERESGLRLVRHGQGFAGGGSEDVLWMERSISALETSILKRKARVKKNPVLTWNSASAMLQSDAQGNRIWNKRKSTGRIDGVAALCMARGLASVAKTLVPKKPVIRVTVVG